ncbi:zwei Ig domain protein zig-8-like isoform X2 [Babylonia areolata]|uniref:zwei Ig domain protein zig-8-like isoform X2 n=1 Tax=Babylonia areolata TaxID=304850 RepID=UPI003FD260F7
MTAALSLCFSTLLILSFCLDVSVCGKRKKVTGPQPSFVPGKMNITVRQGDIATLPCTVQNLGTRRVSWRRIGFGHFLTIGTTTWVQDPNIILEHAEWPGGLTDWNLVVKEARLQDAGIYECQVIHTTTIKWRVHLKVIPSPVYKPAISLEGREFVDSGQTVYLKCTSTEGSRVPDDVDWFKDGDKVDSEKYPHVTITKIRKQENRTLVSELIIERGKSSDSGTYICRSSLEQLASLEVHVLVAESQNFRRGSGSSQTTRPPSRGENRAVTFTFVLGNPVTLTLLVALTSLFTISFVTT